MQPDSYKLMQKFLAELGLVGRMQGKDQLIVSSQDGPVWPNRGNSFWLSLKNGDWYLSTWLPAHYRIPADQDIKALCSACMNGPTTAMYRVPSEIMTQFGLEELDENEFERFFPSE
jgi:hypothetical protein